VDLDNGVIVRRPGEGACVPRPNGGTAVYKAHGTETSGALGLLEFTVPPASPDQPRLGVRAHRHAGEDEAWYILEGELIFTVGEATVHAPAGTFLFVPRGVLHATMNPGAQPARYLAWFTPAGMEHYFDERAALIAAAEGRPDPAVIDALNHRYGMAFSDERPPDFARPTDALRDVQ
jgi:mannose-6-phosphate isomerase-like protein (cupin superfamily)